MFYRIIYLAFALLPALCAEARIAVLEPAFEQNLGQAKAQARFVYRSGGTELQLEKHQLLLRARTESGRRGPNPMGAPHLSLVPLPDLMPARPAEWGEVALRWLGGMAARSIEPATSLQSRSNFFRGTTAIRSVPQYGAVRYKEIYPGIDLLVRGADRNFEYDFEVAPGADPSRIELDFSAIRSMHIDSTGDLVLDSELGLLRQKRPVAFQPGGKAVTAAWKLEGGRARFELGPYDSRQPLTIDPVVLITYLGGSGTDRGQGMATDRDGNIYITGSTTSTNFPVDKALQSSYGGGATDVWVVKLSPNGKQRIYSTYIGGSGQEGGARVRADAQGNAYVSGATTSANFPTTDGAYQGTLKGTSDAFVLKLSPGGDRLVFSTLLGGVGTETGPGLLVDVNGVVCLAGTSDSPDLLTTADAVQGKHGGGQDAFIAILTPDGRSAPYLTYYGGSGTDTLAAIALGQGGNLYFTGQTGSGNFPITQTALKKTIGGPSDAYLVRLSSDHHEIAYASFVGGSRPDTGVDVFVTFAETVLLAGNTQSPDFPTMAPRVAPSPFPAQAIFAAVFRFPRGARLPERLNASSELRESTRALGLLMDAGGGKRDTAHSDGPILPENVDSFWSMPPGWLPDSVAAAASGTNSNSTFKILFNSTVAATAQTQTPDLPLGNTPPFAYTVHWRAGSPLNTIGHTSGIIVDSDDNYYSLIIFNVTAGTLPLIGGGFPFAGGEDALLGGFEDSGGTQAALDGAVSTATNLGQTDDPVVTATGEVFEHDLDLALGGPLPLSLVRFYSSILNRRQFVGTALGENWMHNFDWRLFFNAPRNRVFVRSFRGRLFDFTLRSGAWAQTTPLKRPYQFIQSGTGHQFFDPEQRYTYTFNAAGLLTRVEDTNGNALTVTPGANGPVEVTDPHGRALRFTYTGTRLASVADQTGRSVVFAYTGDMLSSAVDATDKTTTFTYTAVGTRRALLLRRTQPEGNSPFSQEFDILARATRQLDSRGNALRLDFNQPSALHTRLTDPVGATTTHFSFFSIASLMEATDAVGNATEFEYDAFARLTGKRDRLGAVSGYVYDSNGNLTSFTNPRGTITRYENGTFRSGPFGYQRRTRSVYGDGSSEQWSYDARGNLISRVDRAGQTTTYAYNDRGLMTLQRTPGGGTTTHTYNTDTTRASTTFPSGVVVRFEYDNLKRVVREIFDGGATRRYVYDARDRLIEFTDELGRKTTTTWDGNGRRASVTDPLGNVTRFSYDGDNRLVARTNPLGKVTRYTYDRVGRLESETDASGVVRRYTRDLLGRVKEVFDGGGKLFTIEYNSEGVPTSAMDGTGRVHRFTSDLAQQFTGYTDPAGNATRARRNLMGHITSITNPLEETVQTVYDAAGRRGQIRNPDESTVRFGYNADSLSNSFTDERGMVWRRERDAAGRVTSLTDPAGLVTGYAYDARGRLSRITQADGATADHSYDLAGRLIRVVHSDGTMLDYVRDELGRVVKGPGMELKYDAAGRIIESNGILTSYDDAGRIASVTYGPDQVLRYEYNNRGKLVKVTDWAGSVSEYDYDAALRVIGKRRSSGVNSTYAYGADGRLASVRHSGPTWEAAATLTRDKAGRVTSMDRNLTGIEIPAAASFPAATQEFAYSPNNRMEGREYDGRGNALRAGALSFIWDGRNLVRGISAAADSVNLEWDGFGRLVRVGPRRLIWNYAVSPPALARIVDETPVGTLSGSRRQARWGSDGSPPGVYVKEPGPVGSKEETRLIRPEAGTNNVSSMLALLPLMLLYYELGGKVEFHETGPNGEKLGCPPPAAVVSPEGEPGVPPECENSDSTARNPLVLGDPASLVTRGIHVQSDGTVTGQGELQPLNTSRCNGSFTTTQPIFYGGCTGPGELPCEGEADSGCTEDSPFELDSRCDRGCPDQSNLSDYCDAAVPDEDERPSAESLAKVREAADRCRVTTSPIRALMMRHLVDRPGTASGYHLGADDQTVGSKKEPAPGVSNAPMAGGTTTGQPATEVGGPAPKDPAEPGKKRSDTGCVSHLVAFILIAPMVMLVTLPRRRRQR